MANYSLTRFLSPNSPVSVSEAGSDLSTTAALGQAVENFDTYAGRINGTNTWTAAQTFNATVSLGANINIALSGTSTPQIYNVSNGNLDIGTNNTSRMLINNTGEVSVKTGALVVGATYSSGSGVFVGANSTNNAIHTASQGAGTTTLYIGNASINVTSDRRIKTDILPTGLDATAIVRKLPVVDYTWDDPSDTAPVNRNSRGRWTGMVAQDIVDLVPWVVNAEDRTCTVCRAGKTCEQHTGMWQVEFQHLAGLFVKALQEVDARVTALGG